MPFLKGALLILLLDKALHCRIGLVTIEGHRWLRVSRVVFAIGGRIARPPHILRRSDVPLKTVL